MCKHEELLEETMLLLSYIVQKHHNGVYEFPGRRELKDAMAGKACTMVGEPGKSILTVMDASDAEIETLKALRGPGKSGIVAAEIIEHGKADA